MKVLLLLPLLFLAVLAGTADDEDVSAGSPVPWLGDLGEAVVQAAERDRPLMVVFR